MKLIIGDNINNARECIFERSKERLKAKYDKCKKQSFWSKLNIDSAKYIIYWVTTACLMAISFSISLMIEMDFDIKFAHIIIPVAVIIIWHLMVFGYLIYNYINHNKLLKAIKSEYDFMRINNKDSYEAYVASNPKHKHLAKYFIDQMNNLYDIIHLQQLATEILDAEVVNNKLVVNYTIGKDYVVRSKTINNYYIQYLTNIDEPELLYTNANLIYKIPYNNKYGI